MAKYRIRIEVRLDFEVEASTPAGAEFMMHQQLDKLKFSPFAWVEFDQLQIVEVEAEPFEFETEEDEAKAFGFDSVEEYDEYCEEYAHRSEREMLRKFGTVDPNDLYNRHDNEED